jgi:hypothetical protein
LAGYYLHHVPHNTFFRLASSDSDRTTRSRLQKDVENQNQPIRARQSLLFPSKSIKMPPASCSRSAAAPTTSVAGFRAALPAKAAKKQGYLAVGKQGSRQWRADGQWHRCPLLNCKYVAKDALELTGRGHYRDYHGFKIVAGSDANHAHWAPTTKAPRANWMGREYLMQRVELVSPAEGERLRGEWNEWKKRVLARFGGAPFYELGGRAIGFFAARAPLFGPAAVWEDEDEDEDEEEEEEEDEDVEMEG